MTPDPLDPSELGNIAHMLLDIRDRLVLSSDDARVIEDAVGYLRAQADARPVAWIAHNLTTGHVKWTTDPCRSIGWTQNANLRVKSLYAAPAPQPVREDTSEVVAAVFDRALPESEIQALADAFAPQPAEPKREPLSDEQIDAALQSDPAMVLALMSGEMTVGEFKAALRRLARTVERAHEIGGSNE